MRKIYETPICNYLDLECIFKKIHSCQNNSKKPYTEKKMHIPSGYLLFTRCLFDTTKNKLDCYNIAWKRFSEDLKEHAAEIIDYEKRKIVPLTYTENKSYEKQKFASCVKKNLVLMMIKKSMIKSEIIVIILENVEELLMIFII